MSAPTAMFLFLLMELISILTLMVATRMLDSFM